MKFFIFALLLSTWFATVSSAQTVSKVNGVHILISGASSDEFKVGEEVQILGEELDIVGLAVVTKISAGGKTVLAKLRSGQASVGLAVESKNSRSGTDKKNLVRPPERDSYSNLTSGEREILSRGPISTERYVIGGILGTYPLGLGIGHAVQGRYLEKGLIFTVGQLASVGVMMAGFGDCALRAHNNYSGCDGGLLMAGVAGYVVFRVWEIIDVWAAPPEHNRRYQQIKQRLGEASYSFTPAIIPTADGGALLGMNITF